MSSRRIMKVNELLKQEVGKALLPQINFPPGVLVTIIKAQTSQDLRYADVFISVFPATGEKEVGEILEKNIYDLQQKINARLRMKPVPKIRFKIDRSGEYAERIGRLIKKIGLEK